MVNNAAAKNVRIFPLQGKAEKGAANIIYDLNAHDSASVADYLNALEGFAALYFQPCAGCDDCCHERVPLTIFDLEPLAKLLGGKTLFPAHAVVRAFAKAEIFPAQGADITLKSSGGDCLFLDRANKLCRHYAFRPLVCRCYYCISPSRKAAKLRSVLINRGEDALIAELLREEEKGAPPLACGALKERLKKEAYACGLNPVFKNINYADALLKSFCPPGLWARLRIIP
jgi:Fe-S-cluster containining protein